MQLKKIVPLALALTITATASAGAANVHTVKLNIPTSITSQARQQLIQKLMEKFDFSACFPDWDIPSLKPETKPDETPELPEELPEETPDEIPEEEETPELPEEHPEETPDEMPEEVPDEAPDNTPQLPEDSRPDETPDNGTDQTPEDNTGSMQGDFASQVAALVNAERAKYGLSALTVDTRVQQAALVRAKETAQSFSHTRPNGSSFSTALTEAGVSYRTAGENIAYGQSTPQQVMNAWMNSSGHRANILNANYTTIGVGYTVINGTAYWAQLFTA
ncbi:CAP domain-containing protein [Agathobaculum sp.]|uniref:CAP domain-containing protein n=1 Tax=Agathobaculum sp. TaxID=2048138 RepID=UPI0027B87DA0|nr:CAP domain-containing protein [Agathobaculum sp.]